MSEKVVIYHNPRCSKSRETLALLRARGIEPEIVEYLQNPPDKEEVKQLIEKLAILPHDLLRTKEAPYKELGLSLNSTADEVAEAIAEHPILLERPVVVRGDKAAIGRPPENVLPVLG
jgi:arsenate reductase